MGSISYFVDLLYHRAEGKTVEYL